MAREIPICKICKKQDGRIVPGKGVRDMADECLDTGNMTYEEAAVELERAVLLLEKGDLSLEDSISVFEKAIGLVRMCNKKLDEIEKKITILVDGKDGIREKEFAPDAV